MPLLTSGAGLCLGNGKNFGVKTVVVCVIADSPAGDVFGWGQGIELSGCEFSYLCCSVEDRCEAGKESYVEGIGVVELVFD